MSLEKINLNHNLKRGWTFGIKSFVFLMFVLVIGAILFTTFYGDFSFKGITGGAIFNLGDASKYFDVSMELSIPELTLKDDYEKITLVGTSQSPLLIGGNYFSIQESNLVEIVFENFSGKIILDEESISYLEGKASRIVVNGIPTSDKNEKKIKVSIESPISYNSIEFPGEVSLKNLDYISSGKISWGEGNVVRLNDERVEISDFIGEMILKNKKMILDGVVENVRGKDFKIK